jgi:hypothetical protein
VLDGYGSRAQTRTDHVNQVKAHPGFCSATNADLEDARDWLAAGALVQDRPVVATADGFQFGPRLWLGAWYAGLGRADVQVSCMACLVRAFGMSGAIELRFA